MIRKIVFVLMLSVLFSLQAAEFDWGGVLQNSTDASSVSGLSLTQSDSLSFWLSLNVKPLLNFKASGGYQFKYDGSAATPVSNIPEFGALYAYGANQTISWKAGRYTEKDLYSNLFSSIWDGAQVGFRKSPVQFKGAVGFTGLVFSDSSTVSMTLSDYNAISDGALLASPRLAEYFETAFFILPGDGSVSAAFLAQQDMRANDSISTGQGLLHSFYINLGMKGRMWNYFFYDLYVTSETGIYDMVADNARLQLLAAAGGLKVDIALPVPLKPFVSVNLFYSTGGTWDERSNYQGLGIDPSGSRLYQYTPFTTNNHGYVYSVGEGNLFYGNVKLSITPFNFLSASIGSLTLFRAVNGPVSTLPVTQADSSSSLYLGEEVTAAINLRPFSDLGFQLKGGVFIPNNAVVADGIQYKFGGYLSLSF